MYVANSPMTQKIILYMCINISFIHIYIILTYKDREGGKEKGKEREKHVIGKVNGAIC